MPLLIEKYQLIMMDKIIFLVFSLMTLVSSQGTFDCFRDICTRGEQYCMVDMHRCGYCSNVQSLCGTLEIDRDCDSFCVGILLQESERNLNASLNQIQNITSELAALRNRVVIISEKEKRTKDHLQILKSKLAQTNASLQTVRSEIEDLNFQLNRVNHSLYGCRREAVVTAQWNTRIYVGLGLALGGVSFIVVALCLCQHKNKRKSKRKDDESQTDNLQSKRNSEVAALADSGVDLANTTNPDPSPDTRDDDEHTEEKEEEEVRLLKEAKEKHVKHQNSQKPSITSPTNISPTSPSGPTEVVCK